jgi:hypothetical protein
MGHEISAFTGYLDHRSGREQKKIHDLSVIRSKGVCGIIADNLAKPRGNGSHVLIIGIIFADIPVLFPVSKSLNDYLILHDTTEVVEHNGSADKEKEQNVSRRGILPASCYDIVGPFYL